MSRMRHAIEVRRAGCWPEQSAVASLTLPFADRHRRRMRLDDDQGEPLLLDLSRATLLADGDALLLKSGGFVRVRAAAESVVDIAARDRAHAVRLAWHVGNRHVPMQVLSGGDLRILHDHVLVSMLEGLGARLTSRCAPFDPEPGAYAHHLQHAQGHRA